MLIQRIALIALLLTGIQAFAQPGPGDVFREYVWLPTMAVEEGKFLRVGGRLDYKTSEEHFPAADHQEGYIPLLQDIDLKDAIKAEMVVEKLASHEDTRHLRVSLNRHSSIVFPDAEGIPEPASDYMHHCYPVAQIPLDQLRQGTGNSFRFDVDSVQRWGWPQNIIYGVILRIYYEPDIIDFKPAVTGVVEGGHLREIQSLGLSDPKGSVFRVEFVGKYEDVNWEGDGIYNQWHYHNFRGQVVHHIGSADMYPFEVDWNTSWIPDQEEIGVAARVVSTTGLIYFTEAVRGLKLDRNYSVELCRPYDQPKNWVTRADEFTAKFEMKTDLSDISEARSYWVSWSPCYANGVYINDVRIFDREDLCYEYRAHEVVIPDPMILKRGSNIIKTGKEPLHDGQMVHGMEVQWPGIMVKVRTEKKPEFKASLVEYESRPHYRIETQKITYYYDIRGGGFSRIIDEDGNDWVSFKMEPWGEYPSSAAGSYRGIPNMVFQGEDDGAGHPGHDKCRSWIEDLKIVTESNSGKWKWSWKFSDDHAVLQVLSADPDRGYWFLYEGTPGGRYDPGNTYFGTSTNGPQPLSFDYFKDDVFRGRFHWIYAGHQQVNHTFYMIHCMEDEFPDMTSMLGNTENGSDSPDGMTVFGFGRGEGVKGHLKGRQKFIIGMYPDRIENQQQHREFENYIGRRYLH